MGAGEVFANPGDPQQPVIFQRHFEPLGKETPFQKTLVAPENFMSSKMLAPLAESSAAVLIGDWGFPWYPECPKSVVSWQFPSAAACLSFVLGLISQGIALPEVTLRQVRIVSAVHCQSKISYSNFDALFIQVCFMDIYVPADNYSFSSYS